ncbi:MAG: four helix bundle protein [Kiritimatiellia bacterium]
MDDPLLKYPFYVKACELFDYMLDDSELLQKDYRAREIVRQLVRSTGSISANIEEGYGRGTRKEFIYFLTVSCGPARETRGWYVRSKRFLSSDMIAIRIAQLDEIISLLVSSIKSLKQKGAGE